MKDNRTSKMRDKNIFIIIPKNDKHLKPKIITRNRGDHTVNLIYGYYSNKKESNRHDFTTQNGTSYESTNGLNSDSINSNGDEVEESKIGYNQDFLLHQEIQFKLRPTRDIPLDQKFSLVYEANSQNLCSEEVKRLNSEIEIALSESTSVVLKQDDEDQRGEFHNFRSKRVYSTEDSVIYVESNGNVNGDQNRDYQRVQVKVTNYTKQDKPIEDRLNSINGLQRIL
jgi:hypothetical protein